MTETDSSRQFAFPDSTLESFCGNMRQMQALGAAALIRNAMENQHAGVHAGPDALVRWPGGGCRYGEAARLAPAGVKIFSAAANSKIAHDLSLGTRMMRRQTPEAERNLALALQFTTKWYLPEADREAAARMTGDILADLPQDALRAAARGKPAARQLLTREGFIEDFFKGHAQGNRGPARAARAGADVTVETARGLLPWSGVSHISDTEMKAFNIGLADHLYTAAEAIEDAAFALPAKRSRAAVR